jgi:NADH dehydrogenase/NADH:ubiquinone oxidoreductase subunit G
MKIKINGTEIVTAGGTILQVARENQIEIPTLCFLEKVNEIGACRMCIVEIEGVRGVKPACVTQVSDGMVIRTDTERLRSMRRMTLELLCKNHLMACTECAAGMNCKLRDLCKEYGVDDEAFGKGKRKKLVDQTSAHLVRDNSKCILCRRCVNTCKKVQGIGAIAVAGKSKETTVGFSLPLNETDCVSCGQCVAVCPTGALSIHDDTKKAWKSILARNKTAVPVAIVSPYVCNQIGKEFGEPAEADWTGKTAAMLRRIGFQKVYLTGTEVLVCPSWRKYLEVRHPEIASALPAGNTTPWAAYAQALRAAFKEDVAITAFTPCTASKIEEQTSIDITLTTRELGDMWNRACVSRFTAVTEWEKLPEEPFDVIPEIPVQSHQEPLLSGLANAEALLSTGSLRDLTSVLACPGGCRCGGGSPKRETVF